MTDSAKYRVGSHYGVHVYEGDRPVATFFHKAEARMFVEAMNSRNDDTVESLQQELASTRLGIDYWRAQAERRR